MKSFHSCLALTLGALAALPLSRADDPAPVVKEDHQLRVISSPDHRTIIRHVAAAGEKEKVTYLGVETGTISATVIAQLGLTDGVGLVVNHVGADTPAASALKVHDILLKLDDQLLIEQRQLQVLIRNHKDGDEVTLTYLRGGKQATAKVKLGLHEVPKVSAIFTRPAGVNTPFIYGSGGSGAAAFTLESRDGDIDSDSDNAGVTEDGAEKRESLERVLSLMNSAKGAGIRQMNVTGGGHGDATVNVTVNTGNSHISFTDDKGSLDLTIKDGKKELVAKSTKGDAIFSGPIDTPEQRKALPEEVRTRLEKIEDPSQFSFKTGVEFQGVETKLLHLKGESISLPSTGAVTLRPALFL
jgi:serine protease Do